MMSIGEGKSPDDVVKTRRILVTPENLKEVAKDIQMSPDDLMIQYRTYEQADRPLVIFVKED